MILVFDSNQSIENLSILSISKSSELKSQTCCLQKTARKSTMGLKQKTKIIMNILSLADYMISPAKSSRLSNSYSQINGTSTWLSKNGKIWSCHNLLNMKTRI